MTGADALFAAFRHYAERALHIARTIEAQDPSAFEALPFPETFPVRQQLGSAIFFAARGMCRATGRDLPKWPATFDLAALEALAAEVLSATADLTFNDLMAGPVSHEAGQAEVSQAPLDYMARFALPNMIFHLSMAYAGAKGAGIRLGKADFDALHHYAPGFSF